MFKTFEQILQGLFDYVGASKVITDFNPGSLARTLLEAAAALMEECYYLMSYLLSQFWIRTATGEWLDKRANDYGKTRKAGTVAAGTVTIGRDSPSPISVSIPKGTVFQNDTGTLRYTTQDAAILNTGDTNVSVEVLAADIGKDYNLPDGTTLKQSGIALSGIEWVKLNTLTTKGDDIESDDDLRARLLDWIQNPGTSGNPAEYRQWAMDIDGVTGAKVISLWNGPGTVKVVILGTDKKPPDDVLVQTVQNTIAPAELESETRLAPIGAAVTVVGAEPVPINVDATIAIDNSNTALATIQENFQLALTDYLSAMALQADVVRYAKISSLLVDLDGVLDITAYTVNGGTANIPISNVQVAVVGVVNVHV